MSILPENENARLEALHKYQILNTPPERVYDRITTLTTSLFHMPMSLISFIDAERVWVKSQVGFTQSDIPREQTFCARTILSKTGMIVRDAPSDPRFNAISLVAGAPAIRFYAGVPISSSDGYNLGTLALLDSRPHPEFDTSHLGQLHQFAGMISELLETRLKLQAPDHYEQRIPTQRAKKAPLKTVPDNLRFSILPDETHSISRALQILQLVMDNIPQAVFWKDRKSVYIWCNRNFAIDAGVGTPENIVGKTDFDLAFNYEEAAFFVQVDQEVMASGVPQYHVIEPQTQADGKHAWLETNKMPLRDEVGNIIGVLGTYEDITERKLAEEELRNSQQMLQLIMDNIPQAVFWKDRNSVYLGSNPSFAQNAGLKNPEDVRGLTDFDLAWTREQAAAYIRDDQGVMISGKAQTDILEQQRQSNGKIAWVETNKIPLRDAEGSVVGILGTYQDITERKAAQEALEAARSQLEQRVIERTAELSQTNVLLRQEVAERERAESAEREQRTLAEALRDVASALNSTLNLETVLDRILSEIERVLPHDTANIILLEGDLARIVRYRGSQSADDIPDTERRFSVDGFPNLAAMSRTRQPLNVPDTRKSRSWVNRPGSFWVRSFLGAPIVTEERVIGFINLNSATPGFFNARHAERLQAFATQAALAIQNARLYERAQELAAVEERQRLARDLHDAVSQTLWTSSLIAEVLPTLWQQDQEDALRSLEKLRRLTHGALAEMRTLLLELRPAALLEARLGDLLNQLVQATMSRKKIDITLSVTGETSLPPDVQIGVYRIAQETLNNIVKHSHAAHVTMQLICHPNEIDLVMRDDGRGFNPQEVGARQFGLEIMRERAAGIQAKLELSSKIGGGTQIYLHWPETPDGTGKTNE